MLIQHLARTATHNEFWVLLAKIYKFNREDLQAPQDPNIFLRWRFTDAHNGVSWVKKSHNYMDSFRSLALGHVEYVFIYFLLLSSLLQIFFSIKPINYYYIITYFDNIYFSSPTSSDRWCVLLNTNTMNRLL